ncbi:MAG: Ig domain-containing protein [Thermodesulfobacteriota bacterium]
MKRLFRRRSVKFVEPPSLFEQLEERVVLDASIGLTPSTDPVNTTHDAPNDPKTVTVDATDPDVNEATAGTNYDLTVSKNGAPAAAVDTFNTNNDPKSGDIVFNKQTGQLSWTPNNLDKGAYLFEFTSHDGTPEASDVKTWNVNVTNPTVEILSASNQVVTGSLQVTFKEGASYIAQINSTDTDKGATYTLTDDLGNPENLPWLSIDSATGLITSTTPGKSDVGTYNLNVTVNDGEGSDTCPLIVIVEDYIKFEGSTSFTTAEDVQFIQNLQTDRETEGKAVMYKLLDGGGNPVDTLDGLSIDNVTGVIDGNPDNRDVNEAGTPYSFIVRATMDDGWGHHVTDQTFTLAVTNAEPLFLHAANADIVMTESSGVQTVDVQNNDEDFLKQDLGGNWIGGFTSMKLYQGAVEYTPLHPLTWDQQSGVLSWDPMNQDVGTYTLMVTFDDGSGTATAVKVHDFDLTVKNIPNYYTSGTEGLWIEDKAGQTFDVSTHEEGDGVTYFFKNAGVPTQFWGGWLEINPTTGVITPTAGQPDNAKVGVHDNIVVWSNEGHGEPDIDQTIKITVMNAPPDIFLVGSVQEDTPGDVTIDGVNYTRVYVRVDPAPGEPGSEVKLINPPTYGLAADPPGVKVQFDLTTVGAENAQGYRPLLDPTGAGFYILVPTPDNADTEVLKPFGITVSDTHGGIATKMYAVSIANNIPIFTVVPPANVDVTEDITWTFNLNTSDEGQGNVTYTVEDGAGNPFPGWISIDSNGNLSINADNTVVDDNPYQVFIKFNDGHTGGIIYYSFWVRVWNTEPVYSTVATTTWREDSGPYSFDVSANDEGQGQAYSLVLYDQLGVVHDDWQIPGGLTIDATGRLIVDAATGPDGIPLNEHHGDWTFGILADDGHGGRTVQQFTLHVVNNDPIWLTPNEVYFDVAGGAQVYDVQNTDESSDRNPTDDADLMQGNRYTLEVAAGGDVGWLSYVTVHQKWGFITWNGAGLGLGTYDFVVKFSDGSTTIEKPFTMHVVDTPPGDVNHDPGYFSANNTTFLEDTPNQQFDLEYTDEGDANTEYRLSGAVPAGVTLANATFGVLQWDLPTNSDVTLPINGTPHTFQVEFWKDGAMVSSTDFDLHVQNVLPYYNTVASANWTEDVAGQTFNVGNTDEADGGTTYAFKVAAGHTVTESGTVWDGWLRIDPTTGVLSVNAALDPLTDPRVNADFSPTNRLVGTHNFTLLVDDQHDNPSAVAPVNPVEQDFTLTIANRLTFNGPGTLVVQEDDADGPSVTEFAISSDDDYVALPDGNSMVTYYFKPADFTGDIAWLQDNLAIDPAGPVPAGTAHKIVLTVDVAEFNHTNLQLGEFVVPIYANDGHQEIAGTFTIQFQNRDPVFDPAVNYQDLHMVEDAGTAANTININTDDEIGGRTDVTYVLAPGSTLPAWLTLDPVTGELKGDPHNADVRTVAEGEFYQFTIRAYDYNERFNYNGAGMDPTDGYTDMAVRLYVDNNPPVFDPDPTPNPLYPGAYYDKAIEDTHWTHAINTTDKGEGHDPAYTSHTTYSLEAIAGKRFPTWVSINADSGALTGNPKNADVTMQADGTTAITGPYEFNVVVNDTHDPDGVQKQHFVLDVTNVQPLFLNPLDRVPDTLPGNPPDGDGDPTTAPNFTYTVYEDTKGNIFDLLNNDETQHNVTAGTQVTYRFDNPGLAAFLGVSWDTSSEVDPTKITQGKLKIDPTNVAVGANTIDIIADDGNNGISLLHFNLVVNNVLPQYETPDRVTFWEDKLDNIPFDVTTEDENQPHRTDPNSNYYELRYVNDPDHPGFEAPAWLKFSDTKSGTLIIDPLLSHAQDWDGANMVPVVGAPDNHMVTVVNGVDTPHEFYIYYFDGTGFQAQLFHLTINNDPTDIVKPIADKTVTEDVASTLATDDEVLATDEYQTKVAGYTEDYYHLYMKFNDQGNWIPVYDKAMYETDPNDPLLYNNKNDGWGGNDITFNHFTGKIDWQPNNTDVPDVPVGLNDPRHQFKVVHFDGRDTQDETSFYVYVKNEAPTLEQTPDPANPNDPPTDWTPDPADKVPNWVLREDDGTNYAGQTARWTYNESLIESDEEGQGVTYNLWISKDLGATYEQWSSGYKANLNGGGVIEFDNLTGEIKWQTTNADVTTVTTDPANGGYDNPDHASNVDVRGPYYFKVQADDGNRNALQADPPDGGYLSPSQVFGVRVFNVGTQLTAVPPDGVVNEDAYAFNIQATDEEVEDNNSLDQVNTWYTLEVQAPGSAVWVDFRQFNADNDAWGGANVTFNGKTLLADADPADKSGTYDGNFVWDPNHNDYLHSLDAGGSPVAYNFRVTHYDGLSKAGQDLTVPADGSSPDPWSSDTDTFSLTVQDTAPKVLRPDGTPLDGYQWVLTEDDPNAATYTLYLSSDDAKVLQVDGKEVVVDYQLRVQLPGGTWTTLTNGQTLQPSGPDGGTLKFDIVTIAGEEQAKLEWQTRNEDVTDNSSGADLPPWNLQLIAQDGYQAPGNTDPAQITWSGTWSQWTDGDFTARVVNQATLFLTNVTDRSIVQGSPLTLTDGDVYARDEYRSHDDVDPVVLPYKWPADDFYRLEIRFENLGGWIRVDNGTYNTTNNAWGGADFTTLAATNFVKTGAFEWTPNNGDVPNTPDGAGQYRHQFRITHYDGHGTSVTDTFYLEVKNKQPAVVIDNGDPDPGENNDWRLTEDVAGTFNGNWVSSPNEEGAGSFAYHLYLLDGSGNRVLIQQADGTTVSEITTGVTINPEGAPITFNAGTGQITWTPNNADALPADVLPGTDHYRFEIQANDGTQVSPQETVPDGWLSPRITDIDVFVTNDRTAITTAPPANTNITEDTTYTFNIEAVSPNGLVPNPDVPDEEMEREGTAGVSSHLYTHYELFVEDGPGNWVDYRAYNAAHPLELTNFSFNGIGTGAVLPAALAAYTDPLNNAWDFNGDVSFTPLQSDVNHGVYNMKVVHHDGIEYSDPVYFAFTPIDTPPSGQLFGDFTPWALAEDNRQGDGTVGPAYTRTFGSDDAPFILVDYRVTVTMPDGTAMILDQANPTWKPNGPDGGEIQLSFSSPAGLNNQVTVTWLPSNEDVTIPTGGPAGVPFTFALQATDDGGANWSNPATTTFNASVTNDLTAWTATASDRTGANAATQYTELVITDAEIQARDEYRPHDIPPGGAVEYPADDHFNLYVKLHSDDPTRPTNWVPVYDPTALPADLYNTINNAWNTDPARSGDITFDPKTGEIKWTPTNEDVPNPAAVGERYTEFRVVHDDGHGSTITDEFLVEVKNTTPTVNPIPNWPLTEDVGDTFNPANINSNEEGDGLTYHLYLLDSGGSILYEIPNDGVTPINSGGAPVTFNPLTGQIDWTPNNADVGTYKWGIIADDGNANAVNPNLNLSALTPFNVSVAEVQPLITDFPGKGQPGNVIHVTENQLFTDDVQATDEENPAGLHERDGIPGVNGEVNTFYTLDVQIGTDGFGNPIWQDYRDWNAAHPEYGQVSFNGLTLANVGDPAHGPEPHIYDGAFAWTPNNLDSQHGPYTFRVIHNDGFLASPEEIFTVIPDNVDPTLVVTPPDAGRWELVEDISETADFIDTAPQEGKGLVYSLTVDGMAIDDATADPNVLSGKVNGPDGGLIKFNAKTGAIEWNPTNEDVKQDASYNPVPYDFYVVADDKATGSTPDTRHFDVLVHNAATSFDAADGGIVPADRTIALGTQIVQGDPVRGTLTVTDGQVYAIDEYRDRDSDPGTPPNPEYNADDHYELWMRFENNGAWIPVYSPEGNTGGLTLYNAANDTWGGADIDFTTTDFDKTGAFDWTPDNTDVPNTPDAGGDTHHQFRIVHYDGKGTTDDTFFFVDVQNTAPDISPISDKVLTEDDYEGMTPLPLGAVPPNITGYVDAGDVITIPDSAVQSTEEGHGLTYHLYLKKPGEAGYTELTVPVTGLIINPEFGDGGLLYFDNRTGLLQWATTNADVNKTGETYGFKVVADDGNQTAVNPNRHLSPEEDFTVTVLNKPTVITDYPGESNPPTHSANAQEGIEYTYDLDATDEESERNGLNTYFVLEVKDESGNWVDYRDWNGAHPTYGQINFNNMTAFTNPADPTDPQVHSYDGDFRWTPNNWDSIHGPYEFQVTHYDGNGSHDTKTFMLDVHNLDPSLTVTPPDNGGTAWIVHEDDPYTFNELWVSSDQEGKGVYYTLEVTRDGVTKTANEAPIDPGHLPADGWVGLTFNGDGGQILLNKITGRIDWTSTNADTTVDSGDSAPSTNPYKFTITAYDQVTGGHSSPPTLGTFDVDVINADTTVTDGSGNPLPDRSFDQNQTLTLGDGDVKAADELVGPNTEYSLEIRRIQNSDGTGTNDPFVPLDTFNSALNDPTEATWVKFDANRGALTWAPNNRHVGNYEFRITHDDGHKSTPNDVFLVEVRNVDPVITSTPPSTSFVVGSDFDYDVNADENPHHDYRGDDQVTWSIVLKDTKGNVLPIPPGLTIDSLTGQLNWDNPLLGSYDLEVTVDDGNHGTATQILRMNVVPPYVGGGGGSSPEQPPALGDPPITFPPFGVLPDGFRPENFFADAFDPFVLPVSVIGPDFGLSPLELLLGVSGDLGGLPYIEEVLHGSTEAPTGSLFGEIGPEHDTGGPIDGIVPRLEPPEFARFMSFLQEIVERGDDRFFELLAELDRRDIEQPVLGIGGTTDLITELTGYENPVAHGMRLDFAAEEIDVWRSLNRAESYPLIEQPSLGLGGSISPDTPLEGYIPQVEAGKRLDFGFYPVRDVISINVEDLRVSDLLGL